MSLLQSSCNNRGKYICVRLLSINTPSFLLLYKHNRDDAHQNLTLITLCPHNKIGSTATTYSCGSLHNHCCYWNNNVDNIKILSAAQKYFYGELMVNFFLVFNKFGVAQQNITELPNIKVQLNPSCGSRTDTRGWTDRQIYRQTEKDKQMDMLYEANRFFSRLCN